MKLYDWFTTLVIIIMFCILYLYNSISGNLKEMKANWPLYRCNPLAMPFAGYMGVDPTKNFIGCVQNIQSSYMTFLLQPISYTTKLLGSIGSSFAGSLNGLRTYTSQIRNSLYELTMTIFQIIASMIIETQKIMLKFKDTTAKLIGMVGTMLFMMDGAHKSMNSAWKGPPGQIVRRVANFKPPSLKVPSWLRKVFCFAPETLLKVKSKNILGGYVMKPMKNVDLGDEFMDGTIVYSVMKIKNIDEEGYHISKMCILPKCGENSEDIYVTSGHLIRKREDIFHPVYCDKRAKLSSKKYDVLYCLITNNHTIPIGNELFGDWEDGEELPEVIKHVQKRVEYDMDI